MEQFSLAGKSVLVTFPENPNGIEAAAGLCNAGARVLLAGNPKNAETVLESCRILCRGAGEIAGFLPYEQGTEAAASALAGKVEEAIGIPDIFVENGGYSGLSGWDASFEAIERDFDRTQVGLMLTVRYLGNLMARRGSGSVLFLTGLQALAGADVWNYEDAESFDRAFSSTQAFISSGYANYTRQAAGFLGEHGIRCNCLAVAPMEKDCSPYTAARLKAHMHLNRLPDASDIAGAAVFLTSDASMGITGVLLPLDGGYTAK